MSGINVGSVFVTVMPSARGFGKNLASELGGQLVPAGEKIGGEVASGIDKSSPGIRDTFSKWAGYATFAAGLVTSGFAASVLQTGLAYNSLSSQAQAAFTTLLGSGEAAEEMMANIAEFAKTSPFPRQAFIEGTRQMVAFGIEADKVLPIMGNIQDAVAALGGGEDELSRIILAFSQIQSQGKITGDELMQFADVGIDAAGILANEFGVTAEEIRTQISSGAIDAESAITALSNGLADRFGGAAENVKNTWVGAVDRVKGGLRDIGSALVEPFVSASSGGMAIEWANKLADGMGKVKNALPGIVDLLSTGQYNTEAWANTDIGESSPLVSGVLKFRDAITGISALVSKVATSFLSAFSTEDVDTSSFSELGETLGSIASTLIDDLLPAFTQLGTTLAVAFGNVSSIIGFSTWQLFLVTLQIVAAIFNDVLAPALVWVAELMAENQTLINGLVIAYSAYKIALMGIGLKKHIVELYALIVARIKHIGFLYGEIAAWIALRIEVVKNAAIAVAQWLRMAAVAVASGARIAAAWVAQRAAAIGSAAVQLAQFAVIGAQWVWLGIVSMAKAVRMAAAWVIGLGPIAWVIAAIIAAVALIIYYWDEIVAGLEAAWNWISDIAVTVWNSILAFFEEWGWLLFAILTGGVSLIVGWIVDNWDTIAQTTEDIWNGILDFFASVWQWIVDEIQGHVDAVKGIIAWFGGLGQMFETWFESAKNGAISKLQALVSWAKGVPGNILDALGNIGTFLLQAGKDLLNGLWNGMKNMAGSIISWVKGLAGDIASSITNFFGIASPSKLFTYYGEMLGEGLSLGIQESIEDVQASSEILATAANPTNSAAWQTSAPIVSLPNPSATAEDIARAVSEVPVETSVVVDGREIARATERGQRKIERRR